jgi:hypothetical protein
MRSVQAAVRPGWSLTRNTPKRIIHGPTRPGVRSRTRCSFSTWGAAVAGHLPQLVLRRRLGSAERQPAECLQ